MGEDLQDTHDRISSLPDELLLHILSFMPTKDVKKTSLLSRRWTNLWKFAYCLDFSSDPWKLDMVAVIDKSIAQHLGTKLRKFRVSYDYDCGHRCLPGKEKKNLGDAPRVDSWINFAVACNVEEMDLDFSCYSPYKYQMINEWKYTLPDSLFGCGSSLKVLRIFGSGFIDLPNSMSLRSLKELSLSHLDVSTDLLQHLTTCCPLEDLVLVGCNKETNLHISDVSGNLKTLSIDEYGTHDDGRGTTIIVDAPNLRFIEFVSCFTRDGYCIKGQPTHTIASLIEDQAVLQFSTDIKDYEVFGYNLARALNNIHAKCLKLCTWFVQVLSLCERAWDGNIPVQATSIEFHIGFTKWEIPGIAYILKNSPNLETLTINICEVLDIEDDHPSKTKYNFDEEQFWDIEEIDCVLPHIKTVAIHGFPNGCSNAKGRDYNNAIRFVKFLLKCSNVLERVTIFTKTTANEKSGSFTPPNNSELLHDLTGGDDDEVVKASPDAVLCIS